MSKMIRGLLVAGSFAAALLTAPVVATAASGVELPKQSWSFAGPLGTFDRAALQRGYQVYKEVCAACHSLNLVHYRNLAALGFSEGEIKALAAEATVNDGPNDQGEMFERPGRPSDKFKAPFANEQAARAANNGAYPVDLSLIVKARHGGVDYLYAVMTGYGTPPANMAMPSGMNYNTYFPGHMIAMPPPLSEGSVSFSDGAPSSLAQMARDVSTFLAWAAEPETEERKRLGLKVLAFLVLLSGVLYALKRQIWADVH